MKPFMEEEIIDVIWSMEPDKAPDPNEFSFHFYRVCWNVIKKIYSQDGQIFSV